MADFTYTPLDRTKKNIRLLQVLTTDNHETITCELYQTDLADDPKFRALSYTWDRDVEHDSIQCNGQSVSIGKNLNAFLRRYITWISTKPPGSDLPLWIDAICRLKTNRAASAYLA